MTFPELKDFLMNKMRMSHIYQPVMLMSLLKNGGISSIESVAKDLLINDQSQMEYYDKVTKNMVGKVLTKKQCGQKRRKIIQPFGLWILLWKRTKWVNQHMSEQTLRLHWEERKENLSASKEIIWIYIWFNSISSSESFKIKMWTLWYSQWPEGTGSRSYYSKK